MAGTQLVMPVKGWTYQKLAGSLNLDGYIPSTISILNPQNKTYIDEVSLNFRATGGGFEPDSPYSVYQLWGGGYSYSLDGQGNVSIAGNTTLSGLSAGAHWLVVYSYYYLAWGQLSGPYCESSTPVYFTVISTPPNIAIIEPENKTYNTDNIELNFTVDKPTSWITYSLDNQANVTITENTTLSGLTNGLHQITLYANSTSNNTSASKPLYFSVEKPEPFPIVPLAGVCGASVAAVSIGLFTYKRKSLLKKGEA